MNRQRARQPLVWIAVVALALVPFPGRWGVLKDLLPILAVTVFYRRHGYTLQRAGLGRPTYGWWRCLGYGLFLAVALYAIEVVTIKPLARILFQEPKDLALFDPIKGNLSMLLIYLAFMWAIAAFGEEYVWRGFLLRELGESSVGVRHPWALAVLASAVLFGLIHVYQGPRGVFETTISGLVIGAIYVRSGRSSIWLVVLIHGFQNTISFLAIYFDAYYVINFLSK